MATSLLEPNQKIKPEISMEEAEKLVERLYQVKVKKIGELVSYDDRNFLILTETDYKEYGNQFVFKITNCLDSAVAGLIESINEISIFVKSSTRFQVPCPVPDANGNLVSRVTLGKSDSQTAVRLMTYVFGSILHTIEYNEDILFQAGQACGELTKCLQGYKNPILAERQTVWSLKNIDKLESYLTVIEDKKHNALVRTIIRRFATSVGSVIDTFKSAIIHGDINEQNIVVKSVDDKWKLIGLLDFSDAHQAPVVFDLAILCAYLTLDCSAMDPLDAPKYVIAGYQSVLKLTEQELNVLPACMLARFAQSVTLGTHAHQNDCENDYVLSSVNKMWRIMEVMIDLDNEQLIKRWS